MPGKSPSEIVRISQISRHTVDHAKNAIKKQRGDNMKLIDILEKIIINADYEKLFGIDMEREMMPIDLDG